LSQTPFSLPKKRKEQSLKKLYRPKTGK
jgi:hypothetical protein